MELNDIVSLGRRVRMQLFDVMRVFELYEKRWKLAGRGEYQLCFMRECAAV